jgi:hypothetical protein
MLSGIGRLVALALIGAGLFIGWSGFVQIAFVEYAHEALLRMVLPGLAAILAGVVLEEIAWSAGRRRR